MIELIPMALIGVFGYLVYRWSGATNKLVQHGASSHIVLQEGRETRESVGDRSAAAR